MARVLVVDDSPSARTLLCARLRDRGHDVVDAADAERAAELVFANPPDVVVTDLWMPRISGLQLCRLLRAEPSTANVPVILLTASADRRSRFWARCAGAAAYVTKTEIDGLVDVLDAITKGTLSVPPPGQTMATRGTVTDRLSQLLDTALYESTIAGEVRSLAQNDGDMARMFSELAKLSSDVISYRWLALAPAQPIYPVMIHTHPSIRLEAEREALQALNLSPSPSTQVRAVDTTADERALDGAASSQAPLVFPISYGENSMGTLAVGANPRGVSSDDKRALALMASELGGVFRMTTLVIDARRLAATDTLTGLMNRRAFLEAMDRERSRSVRHNFPIALLLLDVDHFKSVNDTRGHDAGDAVLRGIAGVLLSIARKSDYVARWGGEEFVVALPQTADAGARIAAERVRRAIAEALYAMPNGESIHATASVGLASEMGVGPFKIEELLSRADKAMYAAKGRGRNRVEIG